MEIQQHAGLLALLQDEFENKLARITFTQWDTEQEDEEEETRFTSKLVGFQLTDNEFAEKDLLLKFTDEHDEAVEILMELPGEEVDLATFEEGRLAIFGTEAEVVLEK